MNKRSFIQSLNDAAEGFVYVVRYERNMRIHYLFSFMMLLLAVLLGISRIEWIILCITISFVLVAEMINTAIEETVDAIFKKTHAEEARIIKHVSAGAVLVSAVAAFVIGFLIFAKYWQWPLEWTAFRLRYASWHTTFLALLAVFFFVIGGKAFFSHGTPFRGGAISGHSAIAFSLWTSVIFTNQNPFIIGVTFCMAALVAQSRLRAKIHSLVEVTVGAVVGTLVTALFFQIFR